MSPHPSRRWSKAPRAAALAKEPGRVNILYIELERLTAAQRRDLANALLRAAWSAALEETRILLLDLLSETDESVLGEAV